MFKYGASDQDKIETIMYSHEEEDFSQSGIEPSLMACIHFTVDASFLDEWVFQKVEDLFKRARADARLSEQLRQDRIVFFLHLLGLDTNGHAHWPHSTEFVSFLES
jgi:phosphatidylinositol glycan class N